MSEVKSGIYKITSTHSDRIYIGQAKDIQDGIIERIKKGYYQLN